MDRDLLTIDPREVVEDDDALFALLREGDEAP